MPSLWLVLIQALVPSLLPFPITTSSKAQFLPPSPIPDPTPSHVCPPLHPQLLPCPQQLRGSGCCCQHCRGWHGGTFLLDKTPTRPTPWGCNTKFHAGGLRCRPQGVHGEPWVWNKTREDFFSCPALESACERDDLFIRRFITWQNLDGGFLQASSTFLTHFKSFFQSLGT